MAILFPLSTEKAIRLLESENKLVFITDRKMTKAEIKSDLETKFSVKITKVNTSINREGKKRAVVTLAPEFLALDVATNLGLM